MKFFKPSFWTINKINFLAFMLLPLSVFVQIFIFLKNKLIKKYFFEAPIICVGNIYIGGTGKTPLTIEIAQILKNLNKNPAIIKKNYHNQVDEIELIKNKMNNLIVSSNRKKAIENAINIKNYDTIVLDDGLQDETINKDLNIVCFTTDQIIGNGLTIPAGPLREPLSSIVKYQMIVINKNDKTSTKVFEKKIKKISTKTSIYYSKYLPDMSVIKRLKHKKIIAFAGIGNCNSFFNLLTDYNLNVVKKIYFPDHYNYKLEELQKILYEAEKNNQEIITTEKDFYRLKNHNININYLPIFLQIENKDKLIDEIKTFI
jgi:tetraacyldisaccharide 4'-kinase|tara:strand:- start:268 stop:1215 length:948 start_codon:yes stop_codon:yes gene_type:complete